MRISIMATIAGGMLVALGTGANADEKRHPVEAVTIIYEQTGSQTGTVVSSHDDYSRLRYEGNDLILSMMGFTQETKDWNVYRDGYIYHGDPATKTITKTKDPIHDQVEAALADKSPEEIALMFYSALGVNPNGQTGEYAGEACNYFSGGQMGIELCLTDDMLLVYMKTVLGPVTIERIATSVDRGNAGQAGIYDIPWKGYTVTEGPDLDALMKGFSGQ